MSRHTRSRRTPVVTELSPAAHYYLVSGVFSQRHVCGEWNYKVWNCEADPTLTPCATSDGLPGAMKLLLEDNADEIWEAHRHALTAEAKAAGFEAAGAQWFDTGTLPIGEPIDPVVTAAWRRAFLEKFGGRPMRPRRGGGMD